MPCCPVRRKIVLCVGFYDRLNDDDDDDDDDYDDDDDIDEAEP